MKKMINSATDKSFLVLQLNVNGLKNPKKELKNVLYHIRIDIALITEIHCTKYSHFNITGYNSLKVNHPDNTAHNGVAILINSTLYFQPLVNYCHDHIQSCNIMIKLFNISITIVTFYSPPRHNITNTIFTDYFTTIKYNFIIGGNFNAKHNSWGCRFNNIRGIVLYNFINTNNFSILSSAKPTY